jgi:hypothetical protein
MTGGSRQSQGSRIADRAHWLRGWELVLRTCSRRAGRLIRNEAVEPTELFDVPGRYLVTTTTGIYLVAGGVVTWLIAGFGFGICRHRGRIWITLERYLDEVNTRYHVTQFLSFRVERDQAVDLRVEKTLLPGGAHWLRAHDDTFYFPRGENELGRFPWPMSRYGWRGGERLLVDAGPGVPPAHHVNSVLVTPARISVLAHNDYQKTKQDSAIYHLDHGGALREFQPLAARCAHDLIETPEGLLYANSLAGTFDVAGAVVFQPSQPVFSRGVALGGAVHLFGGSVPAERRLRLRTPSLIFVTDRQWREIGRVRIDEFRPGCWGGAVHEIMFL